MPTFGVTAIRTFAHGLASLTGKRVQIEVHGRSAFTDGRTVVLPSEGLWEECDFRSLCGVACHEIAHVWYQSAEQLPALYLRFASTPAPRVQQAYNAVIDVADETRFEQTFPRAEALFSATREQILSDALESQLITATPPQTVSAQNLLATGILWVRSPARSAVRRVLKAWILQVDGLGEVVSILNKARERKSRVQAPRQPERTARQWSKISQLTGQVIEVLDRLFPQSGDESVNQNEMTEGTADPLGAWKEASLIGVMQRAVTTAETGRLPDKFEWESAADQWQDGTILSCGQVTRVRIRFRQDVYDSVWPAFKRVVSKLTQGPTLVRENGFLSGGRLSRPHRSRIDGRCFRRAHWEEAPEAAVAMIFDQSDSMAGCLDYFMPVGAALLDALKRVGQIEIGIWRYGTAVEKVQSSADLRHTRTLGGTQTHLALQKTAAWLAGTSSQRRTVILFTDGEPYDPDATKEAVIRLRRSGAQLLVGAIGLTERQCAQSMPGAIVFSVDPRHAGTSLHVAANRLVRGV